MPNNKEWFDEWFDSKYYHILYKHRDDLEAEKFIDNLISHLNLRSTNHILDMACGKGRHAIYLNRLGYDVTGLDLSPRSIEQAGKFENPRLRFHVHDMRRIFKENYFDYVFNLFTSFGYFSTENEHIKAIKAMTGNLKPGGKLLLDFMNTNKTIMNIVRAETCRIDGVTFQLKRGLENGFIIKSIRIRDGKKSMNFTERVMAIDYEDFLIYFQLAGLETEQVFGNYDLDPYDERESDRMIFLAKKVIS